jgi:hypothetical protein
MIPWFLQYSVVSHRFVVRRGKCTYNHVYSPPSRGLATIGVCIGSLAASFVAGITDRGGRMIIRYLDTCSCAVVVYCIVVTCCTAVIYTAYSIGGTVYTVHMKDMGIPSSHHVCTCSLAYCCVCSSVQNPLQHTCRQTEEGECRRIERETKHRWLRLGEMWTGTSQRWQTADPYPCPQPCACPSPQPGSGPRLFQCSMLSSSIQSITPFTPLLSFGFPPPL